MQLASSPPYSYQDSLGSHPLGRLHLVFCQSKMKNKCINSSPLLLSLGKWVSMSIIDTFSWLHPHTPPSLLDLWKPLIPCERCHRQITTIFGSETIIIQTLPVRVWGAFHFLPLGTLLRSSQHCDSPETLSSASGTASDVGPLSLTVRNTVSGCCNNS